MLRQLTENDIPALVDIEIATQYAPWNHEVFQRCFMLGSQGWVVELNQQVVGFIVSFAKVGEGHILNLGVHPAHQRQGYGMALLAKALAKAKEEAIEVVYLEVRVSNQGAQALYIKAGFKPVGTRKNYYATPEGREDALVFANELNTP